MNSKPELNKEEASTEKLSSVEQPEESMADDIIGVKNYAAEAPIHKKKFLPWHKPRKQYVRETQWCEEILKMVDEVLPENNILKYLGLPGDDLLDIRYFHEQVCISRNLQLRFLGFNNSVNAVSLNKTEFNISLDEVNKLRLIDPASDVVGDDICQIADTESLAWERARKMGPFDAINIDLCDGFGKHAPDAFIETHYNTLSQLLALQSRRPNPWLLFLTTRCGSAYINGKVYELLKSLYGENLDNCTEFKEFSHSIFSIAKKEDLGNPSINEQGVSDIFIVSLVKWIARKLISQNPPSHLEVRSVIGYKVNPKANHQDLVSIAIKIIPTFLPGEDGVGLAIQASTDIHPDECQMALQALHGVSNQINADERLMRDPELKTKLIIDSSELMDAARYDVAEYTSWAQSNS